MESVVKHPNFAGMPNAVGPDGRINWQVSSGQSTSFYAYYPARFQWWTDKADSLGLPGEGNEQDRFTVAARLINPTGYRPCRLCGETRNVGYFYLSHLGVRAFTRLAPNGEFSKMMAVSAVLSQLDGAQLHQVPSLFPNRADFFLKCGVTVDAFERSNHLRSQLLSPGFMGNPPDRLDGFHDYCSVTCRAQRDPGRSSENLRSYAKDRRAFEYWAEGDWNLAQDLFNRAGPGSCRVCGLELQRVSPDHVGPLSCGFAQIPLFEPLCGSHNSSKQRRLTVDDIRRLIQFEEQSGASAMSWYSRAFWDSRKNSIATNRSAVDLSHALRSRQDIYLRCLEVLRQGGQYAFLRSLLQPECALYSHEFIDLDTSSFVYQRVETHYSPTKLRLSLASRSTRIALGSLIDYSQKPSLRRKKAADLNEQVERVLARHLALDPTGLAIEGNSAWSGVDALLAKGAPKDDIESAIEQVLWLAVSEAEEFAKIRAAIVSTIDELS